MRFSCGSVMNASYDMTTFFIYQSRMFNSWGNSAALLYTAFYIHNTILVKIAFGNR